MLFLKWSDFFNLDQVNGTIRTGFRTLMYSLCTYIYELIINLYELFEYLCNGRILDGKVLEEMSGRVGIILCLITLFYVIFSFVKMLIDPDKISDKEAGAASIIWKVILVIILLGVSNFGFKLLYKIQVNIINEHVISNILLPYQVSEENSSNFGNYLSEQLLLSFYSADNFDIDSFSVDDQNKIEVCSKMVENLQLQIRKHNSFDLGFVCLNETVPGPMNASGTQEDIFIINFNVVLAPAAGIAVAYLLLMYCFSVGVRMVQLAFLEVISPIAIVGYLAPKKDNMLTKWWGIYFSTYVDAFIRIAIINFIVFIIFAIFSGGSDIFEANTFWNSVGNPTDFKTRSFFRVIIIIALLTFAKNAPELLKEIMPSTGKSKLSFGAKMKDFVGLKAGLGGFLGATTGAAVGLVGGFAGGKKLSRITGALGGVAGGLFRGGAAGGTAKNLGKAISTARTNQAKASLARAQRISSGASFGERASDAARGFFGMQSGYDRLNQELSMSNAIKSTLGDEDIIKHIREVRQSYIQACASRGETADASMLAEYDKVEKDAMRQMYAFSHDNDSGVKSIHIENTMLGLDFTEDYTSNRGIYNQIKNNDSRAGRPLSTYDEWKEDNNSIKRRIADKTKGSSK